MFRRTRGRRAPTGWTSSGWEVWEDYADEWADPASYTGIWHVTTAAQGVIATGRLKSRQELEAAGVLSSGLGGGRVHGRDVAANYVSVTPSAEAAFRLWRMISLAALAANNRLPAWRVAWETLVASSWDEVEYAAQCAIEWREDGEEGSAERDEAEALAEDLDRNTLELAELWSSSATKPPSTAQEAQDLARRGRMEARFPTGEQKYQLMQAVEQLVGEARRVCDEVDADQIPEAVGFTERWERFRTIDPRSVRLLRVAVRRGAVADVVPGEVELRFAPADVRVVGVETLQGVLPLAQAAKRLRLGRRNARRRR